LNECNISYEKLREYHYVDLFPVDDDYVWKEGVNKILRAIGVAIPKTEPVKLRLSPPFRGEKRIFVNREEYIHNTIKEYLKPSSRVSIIGPGGSGKSQLAFKAIHEYEKEGIFDLVIPIYLDAGMITFDQFLLRLADKLGMSQSQFEKYDVDERKGTITNALSDRNPLILVDNFETILYAISSSVTDYDKEGGALKNDLVAVNLHHFLRRGTNYGPSLPEGVLEDDGAQRGGVFLLIGAHIKRQFEFVQSQWVTDGDFIRQGTEQDHILGNSQGDGIFTIPKHPVRRRLHGLPQFIVVRGGEYCFMPGLRALKWLAALDDNAR